MESRAYTFWLAPALLVLPIFTFSRKRGLLQSEESLVWMDVWT